jgi:hypothetical protein
MSIVPIIISGVFYPKGKAAGDKPMPGTLVGNAAISGLGIGGGPIVPPLPPWYPGHPEHPIPPTVWPEPPIGARPPWWPGHPEHPIPPVVWPNPPEGTTPPVEPPWWPGHPEHPIPPIIWGEPILPPEGTEPPVEGQPPIEWRVAWSESTGWIVVGIPTGPTPTPSK